MKLNLKERVIISNQLKILEKLYPDEADYLAQQRKAIENGYALHYGLIAEHFYDEMTEEECKEVLDILDMYRSIIYSYRDLKDKSEIDEKQIQFPGFDGNIESKQLSYTNYYIIDLGRYDEIRDGMEFPDFNSHYPMLETYRKMLEKWKIWKTRSTILTGLTLTQNQIKELLEK